jgi:hypothetical protein
MAEGKRSAKSSKKDGKECAPELNGTLQRKSNKERVRRSRSSGNFRTFGINWGGDNQLSWL